MSRSKDEARAFTKLYMKGAIFSFLTLGLYYPYFRHHTLAYLTERTRMGDQPFSYTGNAREFRAIFYKGSLLTLVTLGFYFPWAFIRMAGYRLEHTRLQGARLELRLGGRDLLVYSLVSFVASWVTLGLATPWLMHWGISLFASHLWVEGSLDLGAIQNAPSDASATGDSLADAFDVDLGL